MRCCMRLGYAIKFNLKNYGDDKWFPLNLSLHVNRSDLEKKKNFNQVWKMIEHTLMSNERVKREWKKISKWRRH